MPPPLNDDRASHCLLGGASATEYLARAVLALANGCAATGAAVAHTHARTHNRRMEVPFIMTGRHSATTEYRYPPSTALQARPLPVDTNRSCQGTLTVRRCQRSCGERSRGCGRSALEARGPFA